MYGIFSDLNNRVGGGNNAHTPRTLENVCGMHKIDEIHLCGEYFRSRALFLAIKRPPGKRGENELWQKKKLCSAVKKKSVCLKNKSLELYTKLISDATHEDKEEKKSIRKKKKKNSR